MTLYSYQTTQNAFREAVERESSYLAADIGARMDSIRRDLHSRMERLGDLPFQSFMAAQSAGQQPESPPQTQHLFEQLFAKMGDSAAFIDQLEFTPTPPPSLGSAATTDKQAPSKPGTPRGPHRGPGPRGFARQLVIHMATDNAGISASDTSPASNEQASSQNIHIRIPVPPSPPDVRQPPSPSTGSSPDRAATDQLARIFQERAQRRSETAKILAEWQKRIAEGAKKAMPSAQTDKGAPLSSNLDYTVQKDGELIGKLRAQISTMDLLRSVLSRTRRQQGEIPFAIDSTGFIYAANPADVPQLAELKLPPASRGNAPTAPSPTDSNWIVVTRKDPESGLTFGIARPIGESLNGMRRAAAQNFGLGLGMVALALVGILPLSHRMTRNLRVLAQGVENLAQGNLEARVSLRSRDEIGQLARTFNHMAEELRRHQQHLVEQERLKQELAMSRRIQEELLPRTPLNPGFVEVKGVSIPAREVGGDFFNYFLLPSGDVALLVGDVSGKGLPAALLMANLQATLQARLPVENDLARLAAQLDREIGAATPEEVYLTLFMGILDGNQGSLRYVNAGHNTQFAIHAAGSVERMDSTGRPLGLMPGGSYQEHCLLLKKGDSLFLYTDGLVETTNPTGEEFGLDRLEALLVEERSSELNRVLIRVEETVRMHRGNGEVVDDATMVSLKVLAKYT
jgi:serine phosphatase RsbU (regulator of sigma subunit)